MEKRALGKTGIMVTPLCYGCAAAFARNLIDDQQAIDLFRAAYDYGIRFFDTGHSYGKAEERIGLALKSNSDINRKDIIISTKFGTRQINGKLVHDVSLDWVKQSIETSLKRMGIDYIDILYIHGPHKRDLENEKLLTLLHDYKKQGIIRATGANSFNLDCIQQILDGHLLDVVMLDYNIIKQDREPIIQKLYESGLGVVAGQALAEGVFHKDLYKIKSKKDLWYILRTFGRKPSRELFFSGFKYRFLNRLKDFDGAQIALKYVLDNKYISSATFGTVSLSHLKNNVDSLNLEIPKEIISQIKKA